MEDSTLPIPLHDLPPEEARRQLDESIRQKHAEANRIQAELGQLHRTNTGEVYDEDEYEYLNQQLDPSYGENHSLHQRRVSQRAVQDGTAEDGPMARIDPDCKGTLDYPVIDYEDDCCCCCCPPAPPSFCYKRRMGGAFICCEKKNHDGEPKVVCMCGAAWQFSILTYSLIFGISGVVYLLCLPRIHIYFTFAAIAVFSLGLMAITCTGCADPGIVLRYKRPKAANWRYCHKTRSWRPPNTMMCQDNGILVRDLDHFCPWTGTTIAGNNICCFYMFITMIVVTLVFTMIVLVVGLAGPPGHYRHSRYGRRRYRFNPSFDNNQRDPRRQLNILPSYGADDFPKDSAVAEFRKYLRKAGLKL